MLQCTDEPPELAPIQWPRFFRYDRQALYAPYIERARDHIRRGAIPDGLRPFLAYQTWENPQPTYLILPFMFLASAEAAGGITPAHAEYVPTLLLISELMAVADDTVDRTPVRSGRPSFPARFGDGSALPFATTLTTLVIERSWFNPALVSALSRYFVEFFALELWERRHLYPEPPLFDAWLANRYGQTRVVTDFMLSGALIIHGRSPWPRAAVEALSRIEQDVDDLVNVVEYRAASGENDDLQSGLVTRALTLAIAARPSLAGDVAELWAAYRPLAAEQPSIREYEAARRRVGEQTARLYRSVRDAILQFGVPATIREVLRDYRTAVRETPADLRPFMRELAGTFVRRLRRFEVAR
jgi:hypothetical protein